MPSTIGFEELFWTRTVFIVICKAFAHYSHKSGQCIRQSARTWWFFFWISVPCEYSFVRLLTVTQRSVRLSWLSERWSFLVNISRNIWGSLRASKRTMILWLAFCGGEFWLWMGRLYFCSSICRIEVNLTFKEATRNLSTYNEFLKEDCRSMHLPTNYQQDLSVMAWEWLP